MTRTSHTSILEHMSTKTKRTYNLSTAAIEHVRDLATRGDVATSQDGIVEIAIERFYREVRDQEEAALWARAATDTAFQAEMRTLAAEFRDLEAWPSE